MVAFSGCERKDVTLAKIADAAPIIGREKTTKALRATPDGGMKWLADAAMLAHDRFQAGQDATVYAAAVLDTAKAVQGEIAQHAYFLLTNLGMLAYRAASHAYDAGDLALAADLVTAGPEAWQTEAHWLKYPQHEVLRALILFDQGKTGEALGMLQERADVTAEPVIVEALAELRQRRPR